MARISVSASKAGQQKEKRHWASQKPKLDNARKLRGIRYIDSDDMEFQDTMKNVRKKFELPLQSAMPCKVQNLGHGEIRFANNSNSRRSWYACIIEAHESTRARNVKSEARGHEDLIADFNSLTHYIQLGAQTETDTSCNENCGCESRS